MLVEVWKRSWRNRFVCCSTISSEVGFHYLNVILPSILNWGTLSKATRQKHRLQKMGRNAKLRANRKKPQGFSPQKQLQARHHSDVPPPGMKFFKVGEICKALAAIAGRGAWLNVPGSPPCYILPKWGAVRPDLLLFSKHLRPWSLFLPYRAQCRRLVHVCDFTVQPSNASGGVRGYECGGFCPVDPRHWVTPQRVILHVEHCRIGYNVNQDVTISV